VAKELRRALHAAYAAWDADDFETAADALARVVRLPGGDHRQYWFDLALAHKFRRDWPAARQAGLAAVERGVDADGDPTWWNLGIAATALRDWALARRAWQGFGIELEPGDGPIEQDLGLTPVRIEGRESPEVVWAQRLCPARARVVSVPLPSSGRHWGEVVLHDGVPNGTREWQGRQCPVFDEIELFEPSGTPTSTVRLDAAADDVEALLDRFVHAGWGVEEMADVRVLCKSCSEGHIDPSHTHERGEPGRVLIAAPPEEIASTLAAWRSIDPAGRHHGAVERML
jgi:hypothetical protein